MYGNEDTQASQPTQHNQTQEHTANAHKTTNYGKALIQKKTTKVFPENSSDKHDLDMLVAMVL